MKTRCNILRIVQPRIAGRIALWGVVLSLVAAWFQPQGLHAEPVRLGDIDGDGIPSVVDLVYVANHITGAAPLADSISPYADLNEDGVIDEEDVTFIADAILGLRTLPNPHAPPVVVLPTNSTGDSTTLVSGTTRPNRKVVLTSAAGQVITSASSNGSFSAMVPLVPNSLNRISVTATNEVFRLGSTRVIEIMQDREPPAMFVDSPINGGSVIVSNITVLGRVGDFLSGSKGVFVTISNRTEGAHAVYAANVYVGTGNNGSFERGGIGLAVGRNDFQITARDVHGNAVVSELMVYRTALQARGLFVVSGDLQITNIHRRLGKPLEVRILDKAGQPMAGKLVEFKVTRSDGRLSESEEWPGPSARRLQIATDSNGIARVWWTIGGEAGCANNQVSVTSRDIEGALLFCASGIPGLPVQVNVGSGNHQAVETETAAALPLRAWVTDMCNGVPGVTVTFEVKRGGGTVNGSTIAVATTSQTGHAQVEFEAGPESGVQYVEASITGSSRAPAVFSLNAVKRDPSQPTSFSATILDSAYQPLVGVSAELNVTGQLFTRTSDSFGRIAFTGVPSGPARLHVNGHTATGIGTNQIVAGSFPSVPYGVLLIPNATNTLGTPIILPRLNPANERTYYGTNDVVLESEGVAGVRFLVKAGSLRLADDSRPTKPVTMSINQVHFDKMPLPPPDSATPSFVWTVEPAGATFEPPIQVDVPNTDALPPGAVIPLMSYSLQTERLEVVGTAQVSEDGSKVSSDRGSGLRFAGVSMHCIYDFLKYLWKGQDPGDGGPGYSKNDPGTSPTDTPRASDGLAPSNGKGADHPQSHRIGDPVLLGSGEFVLTESDLAIPGRGFPFEMIRTYRSRFDYNGAVGHGWDFCHNQRLDLTGLSGSPQAVVWQNGYGRVDVFTNGPNEAVFEGPPGSYVVIRRKNNGLFIAYDRYGFKTSFREDGFMVRQEDRLGNHMEFRRDSSGVLNQVIDTLGRIIAFSYYPNGRLSGVRDFTGREVLYRYDDRGDLVSVRSPLVIGTSTANDFLHGKITRYEYQSGYGDDKAALNHNLVAIIDPKKQRYLKNVYADDPNEYDFDRVISQTAGEPNQVYSFQYRELNAGSEDLDLNLPKNEATTIDRNGNRAIFIHGPGGNLLEQRLRTNRSINSNDPAEFVSRFSYNADGEQVQVILPEGNSIISLYDSGNADRAQRGNLLSTTLLPGPRGGDQSARLITRKYEPIYNQLRELTDARGNLGSFVPPNGGTQSVDRYTTRWTFDYQEGSDLSTVADRTGRTLGELSALLTRSGMARNLGDVNADGNVTQTLGNAVRIDSPKVHLLPDSTEAQIEGGVLQPQITRIVYNRFGQMTSRTDAEGNVDEFTYHPEIDPDGDGRRNIAQRTLAEDTGGYLAAVVYDARTSPGRRSPSPPSRIRTESFYDPVGNLTRFVDGRGNDTLYEVNALNQVVTETSPAPFRFIRRLHYDANDNVIKEEKQNVFVNGPSFGAYATTTFTYDINNNQRSVTRWPSGSEALVTSYEYDRNNNPIRIVLPEGNVVEQVYDERDLVYSITRGVGTSLSSTRKMTYSGNGNLIVEEGAEDKNGDGKPDATTREYDGYDRLRRAVDAAGNEVKQFFDPVGNVVRIQRSGPNGGATPANNRGAGNVLLSETESRFDELNRRYQVDSLLFANQTAVGPEGPLTPGDRRITTRFEFNRNGQLTRILDDNAHQTVFAYDGTRRQILERDHLGNERRVEYDSNNNATSITTIDRSPEGIVQEETFVTRQEFDVLNRLTKTTDNIGNSVQYSYDSHGNRTVKLDPLGNHTTWIFDGLGRKTADIVELRESGTGFGPLATNEFNSDGRIVTTYKWDKNSRLSAVIDDRGNATLYGYDALNRKVLERFANQTTRIALYDREDNLTFIRDQNRNSISNRYDSINRLIRIDVARGPEVEGTTLRTYEYDGLSRRTRSTDNNDPTLSSDNSVVECSYDSLGRLLVETQNGIAVSTRFDGMGNRIACTYPNQRVVECAFDELNRPKTIRNRGDPNFVAEYDYLGRARVLERRSGNGTRLKFHDGSGLQVGYDSIRRTVRLNHEAPNGEPFAAHSYAHDRAGNRRYENDLVTGSTDVYEYDSAYRLTRAKEGVSTTAIEGIRNNDNSNSDVASVAGNSESEYTFDGVGNWRRKNQDGSETSFQANELNEYSNRGTHDANGNLTQDESNRYRYDFANRLTRVAPLVAGANLVIYGYDPLGRRILKSVSGRTTALYYAGPRLIEERSGFTTARQFVFGRDLDEVVQFRNAQDVYYYSQNALGSVVTVTDASGRVVERYRYDVYGEPTVMAPDGSQRSESVVNNPIRYTGRWYDEDAELYDYRLRVYAPKVGRFMQRDPIGYLGGMGLHAYTGNNPINWTDPLGLAPKCVHAKVLDPDIHRGLAQGRDDIVRLSGAILGFGNGVLNAVGVAATLWNGPIHERAAIADAMTAHMSTLGNDILNGDPYGFAQHAAPGLHRLLTEGEGQTQGDLFETWFGVGPELGVAVGGAQSAFTIARGGWNRLMSSERGGIGSLGGAARKPPLASVIEGHAPGQGFAGVFDPKTGSVLMKPSAYVGEGGALPEGFVSARGGHLSLSNELGRDVNHVGFTGFLEEGGSLRVEWLSRSVNGPNPSFPGPVVPQTMRPGILDAIKAATGRAAQ